LRTEYRAVATGGVGNGGERESYIGELQKRVSRIYWGVKKTAERHRGEGPKEKRDKLRRGNLDVFTTNEAGGELSIPAD